MSGTSRDKNPRRRLAAAERRRVILDAGMQAFAEHGYERASMRAIARKAGVTTPVIYDHFLSKRELLVALLEEREAELRAYQGRERGLERGPELARAVVEDFFLWVEAHPHAFRMLFRDTPDDPVVLAAQRAAQQRSLGQIASFVALESELDLTPALEREAVDQLLTTVIYAVNNELVAWWLEHREVPREEIVDIAFGILWSGIATLRMPRRSPG